MGVLKINRLQKRRKKIQTFFKRRKTLKYFIFSDLPSEMPVYSLTAQKKIFQPYNIRWPPSVLGADSNEMNRMHRASNLWLPWFLARIFIREVGICDRRTHTLGMIAWQSGHFGKPLRTVPVARQRDRKMVNHRPRAPAQAAGPNM